MEKITKYFQFSSFQIWEIFIFVLIVNVLFVVGWLLVELPKSSVFIMLIKLLMFGRGGDLIEHILSFLYNKFLLFVINSPMNPDISITASKV